MDYGLARETLAFALYAKWANGVLATGDRNTGITHFNEARRLYPDIREVRAQAMRHETTKGIVEALNLAGNRM